jgi:hypothetical protein
MDRIGAIGCTNIQHDCRWSASMGDEGNRFHMPAFLVGRQGRVSEGQMHGAIASLCTPQGTRRAGHH